MVRGSKTDYCSLIWDPTVSRFDSLITYDNTKEVETITLDQLSDYYGIPNAIKLDVEGYELNALQGLTRGIALIWFEANLPEFKEESILSVEKLVAIDRNYRFNYSVNTTENTLSKLELGSWVEGGEMMTTIENTELRFMEIFAKL